MKSCFVVMSLLAVLALEPTVQSWDFEDVAVGKLPEGWKVEATGQSEPTGTWNVIKNQQAPLAPGVLALSETNHKQRGVFNICWTDQVNFHEGQIAVFLKAISGQIDQGGGPIWRVQDRNNYYISRFNPLEDNVSIYYVKDGRRIMLGYSGTIEVKDGWHVFKISHLRDEIRAYLDGEMILLVNAGNYIPEPGGVGLWTKADAATMFDNFTVIPK
ncbi:MAG: hypothetical protein GY869_01525 [Planctomycetes bacterium]|nr:hypothetical protein [Planctomycetota bacterium]